MKQSLDRCIFFMIVLFVVFSPISIMGAETCFIFGAFLWVVKMVKEKRFLFSHTALDYPFVIFVLFALLCSLLSKYVLFSLNSVRSLGLVTLFFLIQANVKKRKDIDLLLLVLVVFSSFSALYSIIQYLTGWDFLGNQRFVVSKRSTGFFDMPLTFGEYIGMIFPITLTLFIYVKEKIKKIIFGIGSILCFLGVIFSATRGVWLANICVILFLFIFGTRKLKIYGVAIIIGFILICLLFPEISFFKRFKTIFPPSDSSSMNRIYMWKSSVHIIKAHPLFGVGWGCFKKFYPLYILPQAAGIYSHTHNNFINIAINTGIIGLGIFLWIIIVIFKKAFLLIKEKNSLKIIYLGLTASIISFFVSGLTESNFMDSEVVMLFYFVVSLLFLLPKLAGKKVNSNH